MNLDDDTGYLLHHLTTIIILLLLGFLVMWMSLYWLTWTTGKECISRAMTDVQLEMRSKGYITENKVRDAVFSYCSGSGFKSLEIVDVKPGFNTYPQYLGQPMYVEVVVTYHIFMKDIRITGRSDIDNDGHYGNGYNTKNQV